MCMKRMNTSPEINAITPRENALSICI